MRFPLPPRQCRRRRDTTDARRILMLPKALSSYARFCCALLTAATAVAEPVTPSDAVTQPTDTNATETAPITYEAAVKGATFYAIELGDMSQVMQNSYNWSGPADASMKCQVGFTADALLIKGDF